LNNIRASSINSSTSHLNYHNPFGSKNNFKQSNPLKGRSFGDLSSSSLVYKTRKNIPKRVGSQVFGNNRQQEFLQGKSMNGRFAPFNKKNMRNGSLRSSSVLGKFQFFDLLIKSLEFSKISSIYHEKRTCYGQKPKKTKRGYQYPNKKYQQIDGK